MKRTLALLGCLWFWGCGSKPPAMPPFALEKAVLAPGEAPKALFEGPVPSVAGQRYWINAVPAGTPDQEWGSNYAYLVPGSKEQALSPTAQVGEWELRLHDYYPQNPFKVLQRLSFKVEEGEALAETVAEAPSETPTETPTPVDAAAPVDTPTVMPAAVAPPQANATRTKLGPATAQTFTLLHMRHAARDGGAFYELTPTAAHKFVVVSFPETQRRKEQVIYEDPKLRLILPDGRELKAHSVAAGGVNSEQALQRGDPPRFETEIWMSTVNEGNAYPLGVAFEVPEGVTKALLRYEDQVVELGF